MKVFGRPIRVTRLITIAIISALLFAFLGPFDTFKSMPIYQRLAFWFTLIAGCGMVGHVIVMFALYHPKIAHWPRALRLLVGAAIMAFPGLLVFLQVDYFFRGKIYSLGHWPFLWTTVFVISSAISFANFMPPFINIRDEEKGIDQDPQYVPFLRRLSADLGYELVSLSMKDHYVQVTTKEGDQLIHATFAEAMSELDQFPGVQIHRSHWVAENAISRLVSQGRSDFLELVDGRKLPVSNSYRTKITEITETFQESQ